MFKLSKSSLLLVLILIFSFLYRVSMMLRETFPPGADIGLHNSIVQTIIQTGGSNFLWNNYHMGGGVSLTFPGYHIFVSYIILFTGLPDYVAQAFVVSFFSSLIVLIAFLITRKVWTVSAALIVAFLVAFSRFDIEMLMWGGYPNVTELMLIPIAFYIFLQRTKFSLSAFLVTASLLSGAIFLTHNLSALMFIAITSSAVILATVFSKRFAVRKGTYVFLWLLPLILGALIISPFLVQALPLLLGVNAGTFTGSASDVRLALMATQNMKFDFTYPLLIGISILLTYLFSKKYHGKFFTVPTLLLSMWILIPAIGTQAFLIGLFTDYSRFTYYVYLPVIILIGLIIDYASGFLAKTIDARFFSSERLPRLKEKGRNILFRLRKLFPRKTLYAVFVLAFLLFSLFSVSMFAAPSQGISMQTYYQVMDNQLYDGMQWAKNFTPSNSVFTADATYGWWFAGFAQRQTLSANEPEYLINSREFLPAKNAKNLFDTDFVLDNGLIQVREDGGYIGRHNPQFLTNLNNSYFPYDFFNFNSGDSRIWCRVGEDIQNYTLAELPVREMHMENNSSYAAVVITKGNEFFNLTQVITVYQGVKFANMSITLGTSLADVHLDLAQFLLHTKYGWRYEAKNTIALIEYPVNVGGQLIFTEPEAPQIEVHTPENPSSIQLTYNLDGNSSAKIELFVGVFQVPSAFPDEATQADYNFNLTVSNAKTYADKVSDLPIDVFNYQEFLKDSNVSYVVCRDSEAVKRLVDDPFFSVVFANKEVTIFKVHLNAG